MFAMTGVTKKHHTTVIGAAIGMEDLDHKIGIVAGFLNKLPFIMEEVILLSLSK
jgi:hypothetical protein